MMRLVAMVMLLLSGAVGAAQASVLLVDAAGGGTHTSIQAALADAVSGDEIVVRPGQYVEVIDFLGKSVILRSECPQDPACREATVIDADRAGSVVSIVNGEPVTAILEGFTIRNGLALSGGGVLISNGAQPTVRHNRIMGNETSGDGGGVYVGPGCSPLVFANTIYGNISGARGAGLYVGAAAPRIANNTIDGNQAGCSSGGGLYLAAGSESAEVVRNLISRNLSRLGGGVAANGADVTLIGNRIIANRGWPRGGGLSLVQADAKLISNIIAGNRAEIGSGIDCNSGDLQVMCNTIVGNWATDAAMLLFISGSQVHLTGNILAQSRQGIAVQALTGSAVVATYNNFFNNMDGDTAGAVSLGEANLFVPPGLMVPGAWVASPLGEDGDGEAPCKDEFRREFAGVFFGPGSISGFGQYRIRPDRERFNVSLTGFPPGNHAISIGSRVVGQIFVTASGSGSLEYDTNDGTFPADFPEVYVGDLLDIGGVAAKPLDPVWAVSGDVWQVGNPHLQSSSPLLDAGPAAIPMESATDLDGQLRLYGTAVDIGADEKHWAGRGDADEDGDRDLADFACMQRCLSVIGSGLVHPTCGAVDFDANGQVDLSDWQGMAAIMSGPDGSGDDSDNLIQP